MSSFLRLIAALSLPVALWAQVDDPRDFVVVLDLGRVMTVYRNEVTSVFLNVILKDYLNSRQLDEFHLIGMGQEPRLMFRETTFSRDRVERFLVDLSRVPAVEGPVNLLGALDMVRDYIRSLATVKKKQIILILDGASPGPDLTRRWKEALESFAQTARANQWRYRLVLIPYQEGAPEQDLARLWQGELPMAVFPLNGQDGTEEFANRLLGSPRIVWPQARIPVRGDRLHLELSVQNFEADNLVLRVKEVLVNGANALPRPFSFSLPPGSTRNMTLDLQASNLPETGEVLLVVELVFDDPVRAFPNRGEVSVSIQPSAFGGLDLRAILLVLFLTALAALIVWFLVRLMGRRATVVRLSRTEAERRLARARASHTSESTAPAIASGRSESTPPTRSRAGERSTDTPRTASEPVTASTNSAGARGASLSAASGGEPSRRSTGRTEVAARVTSTSQALPAVSSVRPSEARAEARPPREDDLARFSKKLPNWEIDTSDSATVQGDRDCVFRVEIWTDDFLFQNDVGKRGRFPFAVGEKKVLGSTAGIPIKIVRAPELGELHWDGQTLWFTGWAEGLNFGKETVAIQGREIVWSRPKHSLHILIQPYVSEAEKFKRFLRSLGRTNPEV